MLEEALKIRVQALINGHSHPDDITVKEHPNYEPFVKLMCRMCGAETYVKRG